MSRREKRMNVITLVEDKRGELEQLCLRYHVRRLALFGSATSEAFDAGSSDLDFAVEFASLDPHQHKESYFGLLSALEDLFARPIDLAEYAAIRNPYFRRGLAESEVTLYEAA
jgi:predicted nucleotidyltransferase